MAIDTFRKRACVAGVGLPHIHGVQPETIPDAFYRYSIGNSYLSLAVPPGGTGGEDEATILGSMHGHASNLTHLGG